MRFTVTIARLMFQLHDFLFETGYKPIPKRRVSAAKLPWLFVGIELTDGTVLDKTSRVQELVNSGVPITLNNICMFIEPTTIKRCFYLDEKTLKEEEFPTEGITINDS